MRPVNFITLAKISVLKMNQQPQYLKKGDKIAIVCPANSLSKPIDDAIKLLENWGLKVVIGRSVTAKWHQFAGDDHLRANDIQQYLDDPEIKAIIAGRGGYGTIRIIDQLDFIKFYENPKWIVGFSDVTVLLSHLLAAGGVGSIHGQMPKTFTSATQASLESLKTALFGGALNYTIPPHELNRRGSGTGILLGGNLTLLCMVEGSVSAVNYTDKILFLEDVGEEEFSIDRMMRMLKRSGKMAKLKGLIVGTFNEIPKESIYFGQTPEEIIQKLVEEYDYPVCYRFPIGHIDNNLAMVVGKEVELSVENNQVQLTFL